MQIYVVQSGDSLFSIAKKYKVTVDQITSANGIDANTSLVTGQTLLVPIVGSYYTVKSGDSMYKVAKKNGISVDELAKINNIKPDAQLSSGQVLYLPAKRKIMKEINAYVQPTSTKYKDSIVNDMKTTAPILTYDAIFGFEVNSDGTLKSPPLEPIVQIGNDNGVTHMFVVTNIQNGDFSPDLASKIFNNNSFQNKVITETIQTAQKLGFKDIHFDFENIYPQDREPYNQFLRNVKAKLPKGYTLSTTLVPKTSSKQSGQTYTAHDYKAQGQIVDYVVIMTYDWGWQGGPPMAVSPIDPVRKVLEYAISEMPASKIMMGQNLYGFDWKVPYAKGNPPAKAVSSEGAVQLAKQNGVSIQYDAKSEAPFFKYTDGNGQRHEVWFEDARSIQAKFDLVRELKLRGISYWKLGLPFYQNWSLLKDNFKAEKR